MSLTLHFHPLSSFCQKVLIALYENGTAFTPNLVDLGNPDERAALLARWPIGKFPVLHDAQRNVNVPESSVIIEFLQQHYPGPVRLIPQDATRALEVRLRDRCFDLYLNMAMQKVVGDRLRPAAQKDGFGVAEAMRTLRTACDMLDAQIVGRSWIMGEDFSMADCAAAPALFYVDKVMPLAQAHANAAAYLERLMRRPSYARALKEAEPYFKLFPQEDAA